MGKSSRRGRSSPPTPLSQADRGVAKADRLAHKGLWAEAQKGYQQVLAKKPRHAGALHGLARVALAAGQYPAALALLEQALTARPGWLVAIDTLARAHFEHGQPQQAIVTLRQGVAHDPQWAAGFANLGRVLFATGQLEEATRCCQQAIILAPEVPEWYNALATIYIAQDRPEETLELASQAVTLAPEQAEGHYNRAVSLAKLGQWEQALPSFERALALHPDIADGWVHLAYLYRLYCMWDELATSEQQLKRLVSDPGKVEALGGLTVLNMLFTDFSPQWQRHNAQTLIARLHPPQTPLTINPTVSADIREDKRLTIGYLSSDFRDHAVATLVAGLFEQHDRDRFRILGFSIGEDDGSQIAQRIADGVDTFISLNDLTDEQAARAILSEQVDILVDLNGHTGDARLDILARKPAPIQATWLGFAGTTGAPYLDYILVDPFVAPPEGRNGFSEQTVWLGDCYLINDDRRKIQQPLPTRVEAGLPETGFVWCAFNDIYKFTPKVFDLWMSLLADTPGSVLWVRHNNDRATANLRQRAERRGVDPDRLIWAPRVASNADHLARLSCADLMLDTLPYNGHSTTCDALWAGVPVLTCSGDGFAARVAGSLLHAVGLPELVTDSLEQYQQIALELATAPERLAAMRHYLQNDGRRSALFDTARTTSHLETAYEQMWQRHQAGQPPADLIVSPLPDTSIT